MIRLIGNHRVIGAIENSAKNSTLPHAIILEGDEGTGKHTLAEFIALSSVCSGVNKPCEVCRECRLFLNKNHPDVAYIKPEDKKKSISVEQSQYLPPCDIRTKPPLSYRRPRTRERPSQRALR